MPLVDPLPENHDQELVDLIQFFRGPLGTVPNSVLTMQRRPKIARAFTELNKAVMENGGRVTAEQKRLIGFVASHAAGCRYCEAHTILAAERFGASAERMNAVWNYASSPLFTAAEKAAFRRAAQSARLEYRERYSFSTLWNGVSVEINPDQLTKLARLPGVKGVYPVVKFTPPVMRHPERSMFTAISLRSSIHSVSATPGG